jgi:hypothetical protein
VQELYGNKKTKRSPELLSSCVLSSPSLFPHLRCSSTSTRQRCERGSILAQEYDVKAGTISVARRSRGFRILGIETIADGSPVRLAGRAQYRVSRTADMEGGADVLRDGVPNVTCRDPARILVYAARCHHDRCQRQRRQPSFRAKTTVRHCRRRARGQHAGYPWFCP